MNLRKEATIIATIVTRFNVYLDEFTNYPAELENAGISEEAYVLAMEEIDERHNVLASAVSRVTPQEFVSDEIAIAYIKSYI